MGFFNLKRVFGMFAFPEDIEEVEPTLSIVKLNLVPNPRWQGRLWGYRPLSYIDKIIVHQELGELDTIGVHNYHISVNSHLKEGGAPKITYHYTIEKNGVVYSVNDLTDVTWHTRGENLTGIGIMLVGDFDGENHKGKSKPTPEQLDSLEKVLNKLTTELFLKKSDVYGHISFGKKACPGYEVMKFIKTYKEQ